MSLLGSLAGLAGLTAVVLAALLLQVRKREKRLERAVQKSAQELERLQSAFHRFAPQEVVEDIISRGIEIHGERRDVTILFADLIGFTSLSERIDPQVLVRILNGYFAVMSRVITANRGHLSKFMGDGLMALFGAPEPNPWQAADAVSAALAMREALNRYNATLRSQQLPDLEFGIGIHSGPLVAGVVGSDSLLEYTVIGDTVNLAARVESLTRVHGADILITEDVQRQLDGRFHLRSLPPIEVKGKTGKIATFAVS